MQTRPCAIAHWHFCPKMMSKFSLQFSLHFGEKIFQWDQRENTQVNVQEERKRKKKKEKSMKQSNVDKPMCNRTWEFLSKKRCPIFLFNFLSILGRKLFGGPREKTPEFHHLFSFFLTQPNILQKNFLCIFSSQFSIHHISPPNKHTLNVIKNLHFKKC